MPTPPHDRVPHLRDGFIVAKVGRVAHPLQSYRKPGSPPASLVGWKGWVIERSETAVNNSIQEEAPE